MPTPRTVSKTADQSLPARLARMDGDRLRRYRENLAFYEGRQWQGSPRRGERRLTFNYAKAFVDKAASYLLFDAVMHVEPNDGEDPAARARARATERALRKAEALNGLAQLRLRD
ncbi:MAG: hypothetical protein HS107_14360 [Thermoflexaceae bacterium]|nr:hypothetical protein [Thermoflexaceae bacterium]